MISLYSDQSSWTWRKWTDMLAYGVVLDEAKADEYSDCYLIAGRSFFPYCKQETIHHIPMHNPVRPPLLFDVSIITKGVYYEHRRNTRDFLKHAEGGWIEGCRHGRRG